MWRPFRSSKRLWRALEVALTAKSLVALLGGTAVTVIAAIRGAFADWSKLAQILAAVGLAVFLWLLFLGVLLLTDYVRERRRNHSSPHQPWPLHGFRSRGTSGNDEPGRFGASGALTSHAGSPPDLQGLYDEGRQMLLATTAPAMTWRYGSAPTEAEIERWQGKVRRVLPLEYRPRFKFERKASQGLLATTARHARPLSDSEEAWRLRESLGELQRIMDELGYS